MEQTQLKDSIFPAEGNMFQASDLVTHAETQLSLKKDKNNKMWAIHPRNFDKQLFHKGKSILPFQWTICTKQIWRYKFFDNVFQTLNQHLASDLLTGAETELSLTEVKNN